MSSNSITQPRSKGGKFAPKNPLVASAAATVPTEATLAAIELAQNPEALRLSGELATAQSDLRVSSIALEWQKAEVARLAESLRLAEQGRDEANRGRSAGLEQITKLQEQATANRREVARLRERIDTLGSDLDQAGEHIRALEEQLNTANADHEAAVRECTKLRIELSHASADVIGLTSHLAEMERLRNAAEGRYVALQSRRTLETTLVILSSIAAVVIASLAAVYGGIK